MSVKKETVVQPESILVELDNGLKFDKPIEVNKLTVLTGLNGTGKSLISTLLWVSMYTISLYTIIAKTSVANAKSAIKGILQYALDKSLTTKFTGLVKLNMTDGSYIHFEFVKNNVVKIDIDLSIVDDQIPTINVPIYFTADMRLFSDIDKYLKLRKKFCKDGRTLDENAIEDLLDVYRFHEIISTEKLIGNNSINVRKMPGNRSGSGMNVPPVKDLTNIRFDLNLCKCVGALVDGTICLMSSFSSGEQSFLMTNIGLFIVS